MDSWSEEALNWLVSGMPGPVRWRDIQRAWAMASEQAKDTEAWKLNLARTPLKEPGFSFEGVNDKDPFIRKVSEQRNRILANTLLSKYAEERHNMETQKWDRSFYPPNMTPRSYSKQLSNDPYAAAERQGFVEQSRIYSALRPHWDSMISQSSAPKNLVLFRGIKNNSGLGDHMQPGYVFNDPALTSWSHDPNVAQQYAGSKNHVILETLPMEGGEKFYPLGRLTNKEWVGGRHQNFEVVSRSGNRVVVRPTGENPSAVMLGQPKPVPAVQNYRPADPEASRWSFKNGKLTYDATDRVQAGTPRPQTPRPSTRSTYEMMEFPGSNIYVRSNPMLKAISNPYLMLPMTAASMYADARQQGASRKDAAIQAGVNTGVGASVMGGLYAGLGRFAPAAQAPAMHALGGTVSGAMLGNDLERIATGNYNQPTSWTGGILGGLGGAAASVTPYGRAAAIGYGLGSLVEPFVRPVVAPAMDFAVNKVFDPSMNYVKGLLGR